MSPRLLIKQQSHSSEARESQQLELIPTKVSVIIFHLLTHRLFCLIYAIENLVNTIVSFICQDQTVYAGIHRMEFIGRLPPVSQAHCLLFSFHFQSCLARLRACPRIRANVRFPPPCLLLCTRSDLYPLSHSLECKRVCWITPFLTHDLSLPWYALSDRIEAILDPLVT